jgi:NADPH:quinone reductase-like Zn-dependent oxidoreductase
VSKPSPKDNEVLVKVRAVSINDWDNALLFGDAVNRFMNGFSSPKRTILGSDIAGTIEAAGRSVIKFKIGDEVYGDLSGRWGGLAEYCVAAENALSLKPSSMSFEEAAAIPQAGMLAVQGLIDAGKICKGKKVLINGAGGGVGTLGLQIAKTFECEVAGVDRKSKLDMMTALGFDEVIDYTSQDFTRNGKKYDLILDVKTNHSPWHYTPALQKNGIYVTVGGSIPKLLQALFMGPMIKVTLNKNIRVVALKPNKDLAYMNDLYNSGKLKPVIDGPYPFEQYAEAFNIFNKGEHKGKVVIRI